MKFLMPVAAALALTATASTYAQKSAADGIAEYRKMLVRGGMTKHPEPERF